MVATYATGGEDLYNSNSIYPQEKLTTDRKSFRGYELLGVETEINYQLQDGIIFRGFIIKIDHHA